jgi:acetyl esterase/lipase
MRSISYRIQEAAVRLTGYKKIFSLNESELKVYINNNLSDQKTAPPKFMGKRHVLRELTFNGKLCYVITPKTNVSTKTVLFLHGGGFMMEANFTHWMAVSKLVNHLGVTVYFPVYPLVPQYTEMVLLVYAEMLKHHAPKDIIFWGDSAGATLSMIFCHHNKTLPEPLPVPDKLILVSPGTEVSPEGELLKEMKKIQPHDPLLSIEILHSMASFLVPGLEKTHYFLSPIYGDFTGFPNMYVFSGTYEIFYAQAPKLVETARAAGVSVKFYPGEKMMHDWPYMPFSRECKNALNQIFDIIRTD